MAKPRARRRTTVVSVLGELLITAGVLALGFVGWQLELSDDIVGSQQQAAAEAVADGFGDHGVAGDDVELRVDDPPVGEAPGDTESLAVVYIPAFGEYARVVGEGTSRYVLDSPDLGLAHYESSAMPGGVGNFAIAGHRNGQGGPFTHLDDLRVGDRIYVQTADAWYVYEFRNAEYVAPSAVEVVAPVPGFPDQEPVDQIMTLTTCNPEWSSAGRLIAYASFVGWQPLSDGMPAELADAMEGR